MGVSNLWLVGLGPSFLSLSLSRLNLKVFSILFVTNLGIELQSLRVPALGKEA